MYRSFLIFSKYIHSLEKQRIIQILSILRTKCGKMHVLIREDCTKSLEIWNDIKIRNEFKYFNLITDYTLINVDDLTKEIIFFFSNFGPHGSISDGCM